MSTHITKPPVLNHKPRPPREITIPTLFQLVIQCRDENQQRELYEQLTAAGHTCKVMTL
jgi:hypothetical protein